MPITYIPYTKNISSSILRDTKHKIGMFNTLLCKVSYVLKLHNIPYYLDCGTLLGCVRNNAFIEYDKDVDVTIQYSMKKKVCSINFKKYNLIVKRIQKKLVSVQFPESTYYCDIYLSYTFPKLSHKLLNGIVYPIPIKAELYLEQLYGKNWRIPSSFHCSSSYLTSYSLLKNSYSKYIDIIEKKNEVDIIKKKMGNYQLEIINYYLRTRSLKETCRRFRCRQDKVFQLLSKYRTL